MLSSKCEFVINNNKLSCDCESLSWKHFRANLFYLFLRLRDWKKLTFYYFADAYINFNSLVTDLFKIYKTRIWMSAINPASFVTPSAGPQPPPGALGYGQDGGVVVDRRSRGVGGGAGGAGIEYSKQQMNNNTSSGSGIKQQQGVTMPSTFTDPTARDHTPLGQVQVQVDGGLRTAYLDPYQAFGIPRQPDNMGGMQQHQHQQHQQQQLQQSDPFSSFQSASNYGLIDPSLGDYGAAVPGPGRTHPNHADWTARFQGLSLNS